MERTRNPEPNREPRTRNPEPGTVPDTSEFRIQEVDEQRRGVLLQLAHAATEHITALRNLSYYFNSYTTISDRTPELLSTMDSLERVTFDACHGLTNAGVARLARLPRLRELRVSWNAITSEVRAAFPPRVRVHYAR